MGGPLSTGVGPLIAACLWVFAAAGTALLPMRFQIVPGLALLAAAPVLVWWLGASYGAVPALLATLAVLSMFRRPLMALGRRLAGRPAAGNSETAPADLPRETGR